MRHTRGIGFLAHRLAYSQLTAAANQIHGLAPSNPLAGWISAAQIAVRHFSEGEDVEAQPQPLVTAYLKVVTCWQQHCCTLTMSMDVLRPAKPASTRKRHHNNLGLPVDGCCAACRVDLPLLVLVECFCCQSALSSLSIAHGELDQLVAYQLSNAALTAWALTKTATHPAVDEAAEVSRSLLRLLNKLDGSMLWQQKAAASPLGELLWQVAVGVASRELWAMSLEDQTQLVEYQAVQAMTG